MLHLDTAQRSIVLCEAGNAVELHVGVVLHLKERQIRHVLTFSLQINFLEAVRLTVQEALLWKLPVAYIHHYQCCQRK